MDAVGESLLQRVKELLNIRTDVDRPDFGRAIGRGHSWISEFFNGLRTTNDLRLVLKMARFFRVRVGYLLKDDPDAPDDPALMSLMGLWPELTPERKDALIHLALVLRRESRGTPPPDRARAENSGGETRTGPPGSGGPRRKVR